MVENNESMSAASIASDIELTASGVRGVADILGTMACSSTDGSVFVRAEALEVLAGALCGACGKLEEVSQRMCES